MVTHVMQQMVSNKRSITSNNINNLSKLLWQFILFSQECFTRVLKGHIGLGTVVFPKGTKGLQLLLFNQTQWQCYSVAIKNKTFFYRLKLAICGYIEIDSSCIFVTSKKVHFDFCGEKYTIYNYFLIHVHFPFPLSHASMQNLLCIDDT